MAPRSRRLPRLQPTQGSQHPLDNFRAIPYAVDMPRSSEVEQIDGTPVVVTCATGSDASELRSEADRLSMAAHPGVVRVPASQGADQHWGLRTEHAGRSLERADQRGAP